MDDPQPNKLDTILLQELYDAIQAYMLKSSHDNLIRLNRISDIVYAFLTS